MTKTHTMIGMLIGASISCAAIAMNWYAKADPIYQLKNSNVLNVAGKYRKCEQFYLPNNGEKNKLCVPSLFGNPTWEIIALDHTVRSLGEEYLIYEQVGSRLIAYTTLYSKEKYHAALETLNNSTRMNSLDEIAESTLVPQEECRNCKTYTPKQTRSGAYIIDLNKASSSYEHAISQKKNCSIVKETI